MVHLISLEIRANCNRVPPFVDHHRIVVIKGVVHKDRRTAQIGTDRGAATAASIKVNAGDGIESHWDSFDRRKPWIQTGSVGELVSALRVVIKQVIIAPREANANGIQQGRTENM